MGVKFDAKWAHNTLAEAFAGIESEKLHLNEAT
jgi:hypothetical protein